MGFTDVLGGELGISLGCSLGGKITVASNPWSDRVPANSPDEIESSLFVAVTSVLTQVQGGAVIVMKTCKHCLPDTSIQLSSTILVQFFTTTSGSTSTIQSLGIKARLLARPDSRICVATLVNRCQTSTDVTSSARAVYI